MTNKIRDQAHYDSLVEAGVTPLKLMRSWKPEVIADRSGQWTGNCLRFATAMEAKDYVKDLAWRWTAVREWRVTESDDPVSYTWDGERAVPIKT
jgi:hypothetical protein